MPLVRIDMWPTVTRDQKKDLIRKVTDAVVGSIGCPEGAVEVMLYEVDKADWAIGGVCQPERRPGVPPSSEG